MDKADNYLCGGELDIPTLGAMCWPISGQYTDRGTGGRSGGGTRDATGDFPGVGTGEGIGVETRMHWGE